MSSIKPPDTPSTRQLEAERAPLSFHQQRLWMHEYMHAGSTAYNLSIAFQLDGPLIEEALGNSFKQLVSRHAILRTKYDFAGNEPVQVIEPEWKAPLECIDFPGHGDRVAWLDTEMTAQATRHFDLRTDMPLRARLLRLRFDQHVLVITVHHIAADGRSVVQIVREILHTYEGILAYGQSFRLPALPSQYADYARWQRHRFATEFPVARFNYWRAKLDALPQQTLARKGVCTGERGSTYVDLPDIQRLLTRIFEIERTERVTRFMFFLAVWHLLLALRTGENLTVSGTDVEDRVRPDWEQLIGFFSNQIVLCTKIDKTATFRDMLMQVRHECLESYAQDVPYHILVERLKPARRWTATPWIDNKVLFTALPRMPEFVDKLKLRRLTIRGLESRFPMTLRISGDRASVNIRLHYDRALYKDGEAHAYADDYCTLVEALVQKPGRQLGAVCSLS